MSTTHVVVPKEVQRIIVDNDIPIHYATQLPGFDPIQELQAKDFEVGGFLVIPNNGFDLADANVEIHTRNLDMVQEADIFGGPGIGVYRKVDPNAKSYVVATIYGECLAWMEW